MNTENLKNAKKLCEISSQLYHEAEEELKAFMIENLELGKPYYIPEDVEFTVEGTGIAGDFAYVSHFRIVKPYECWGDEKSPFNHVIEIVFEEDDETVEYNWKRLNNYTWDLGTLIDVVGDMFGENHEC